MTDDDLRALVREAVARHIGPLGNLGPGGPDSGPGRNVGSAGVARHQSSFGLLPLMRGGDGDGTCLIEPAVRCNHCGYCLSYGH